MKRVLCVYDITDSERLINQFNKKKECAKFLNISISSIDLACRNKVIIKKQYSIEWVNLDE